MNVLQPLLRRALIAVAVAAIGVGTAACQPPAAGPAPAAAPAPSESSQVIAMINQYRADNGVGPLAEAGDAAAKAQQHSDEMAGSGSLYHSSSLSDGIQPGWSALGENVGVGSSADQLQGMFEGSPAHNANLLNAGYNQIGVGVTHDGNGQIWVTQTFVGR